MGTRRARWSIEDNAELADRLAFWAYWLRLTEHGMWRRAIRGELDRIEAYCAALAGQDKPMEEA